MGLGTIVLLPRSRLPSAEAWQRAISATGRSLTIDTGVDLTEFEGFLPCGHDGEECGFEYFIEVLDRASLEGAGLAVPREWDTVITLVTRSSYSDLRAACIAAAALSKAVEGGLMEDGAAEIVPAGSCDDWLSRTLAGISASVAESERREALRAEAITKDAGDLLTSALSAAKGISGIVAVAMGRLVLTAGTAVRVMGASWQVSSSGATFDCSRYSALREQQLSLLGSDGALSEGALDALQGEIEKELDHAGELDERDADLASEYFGANGSVVLSAARWVKPNCIVIETRGTARVTLTWKGEGTSSLSVSGNGLRWSVSPDGVQLE